MRFFCSAHSRAVCGALVAACRARISRRANSRKLEDDGAVSCMCGIIGLAAYITSGSPTWASTRRVILRESTKFLNFALFETSGNTVSKHAETNFDQSHRGELQWKLEAAES